MVTVDLRRNKKQAQYFYRILQEMAEHDADEDAKKAEPDAEKRKLIGKDRYKVRVAHYGGAIRGGKTYVTIALGCSLAKRYPGSKGVIMRRAWPDLQINTIPQFKRITEGTQGLRWRKSKDDYFVEFPNGSTIRFLPENAERDPEMNRFKGLECNWMILEQLEEFRKETFIKAMERVGSLYVPKMPPGIILTTFNPTYNWLKEDVYDAHLRGELPKGHIFVEALPSDGDWVTQDQWESWAQMDDESYARFVEAKWDFKIDGQFIYAFDDKKHLTRGMQVDNGLDLWLSFDFNVDPMTCIVAQTDYTQRIKILKEYRQPNSDTYKLCEQINADYAQHRGRIIVTGDASGNNRQAAAKGSMSQYQIIMKELHVGASQVRVATHNPEIASSRTFCNSIMQKFPSVLINEEACPFLIKDLRFVLTGRDEKGKLTIQKTGLNKFANMPNQQLGHLMDCFRYFLHRAVPNWIKIPKS